MKHEALVQLAVGAVDAEVLCPYNAAELGPALIDGARHAHPEIFERGRRRPSSGYRAGGGVPPEPELPPPDSAGQGLWVVNHVSDLVEMRSGPAGTTTRLHFRLPGG